MVGVPRDVQGGIYTRVYREAIPTRVYREAIPLREAIPTMLG